MVLVWEVSPTKMLDCLFPLLPMLDHWCLRQYELKLSGVQVLLCSLGSRVSWDSVTVQYLKAKGQPGLMSKNL